MDHAHLFDGNRTIYTIIDEDFRRSSITIDKWAADLLQGLLPDVHAWIQLKFEQVCARFPHLTRMEKGNFVRQLASFEAQKSPDFQSLLDSF